MITYMFTGLLFNTKDMKKRVQVPQRNEILSLDCTALGFISKKIYILYKKSIQKVFKKYIYKMYIN